jgi:hypothetical protein
MNSIFRIMLLWNGLTTYDYIVNEQKRLRELELSSQHRPAPSSHALRSKNSADQRADKTVTHNSNNTNNNNNNNTNIPQHSSSNSKNSSNNNTTSDQYTTIRNVDHDSNELV